MSDAIFTVYSLWGLCYGAYAMGLRWTVVWQASYIMSIISMRPSDVTPPPLSWFLPLVGWFIKNVIVYCVIQLT